MRLKELAELLITSRIHGDAEVNVTGIESDSRQVKQGDLFICLKGFRSDGHEYVPQAIEQGAVAIVTEQQLSFSIPQIIVSDTRYALALMSCHFYDYPSSRMKLIGITGTNGKTTTSYLIERILADQGWNTGLMGTIEVKIGSHHYEAKNTTQDVLNLQRSLHEMMQQQIEYCTMEVSSHALDQGRVLGCDYHTAIFTNLTQDHLDYHGSMENYLAAKSLLFARMGNGFAANRLRFAILNADDEASEYFRKITPAQVVTYGIDQNADVRACDIQIQPSGTQFRIDAYNGTADIHIQMIGKFSVYNALAATTAALMEGIALPAIKQSLEQVEGVPGRFEIVFEGQSYMVIVDYAHTPDGLKNVLSTIRDFAEGRVMTVFGCGGDRDRSKRSAMGKIAAAYSDQVWITSDNPRTENPWSIIKDIEQGVQDGGMTREQYQCLVDRKNAIEAAVEMASPKDVVLIAGKGHETYQEVNGIRNHFDDREIARDTIRRLLGK